MDDIVIKEVTRGLKKRKIKVRTGVKVEKLDKTDSGVSATLEGGDVVNAEMALISVGRVPVSKGLGFEEAGIVLDRGYVTVDRRCGTCLDTVYAIGDVTGMVQLAHVASEQGMVAVENIMGHKAEMSYDAVPSCVFTDPEVANVGLTEKQVQEKGYDYRVGTFPFRVLGKAHSDGEIDGTVKVIGDAKSDKLLGIHMIGHGASEIIAEAVLALKAGVTAQTIIDTIHAHPTLPEAFKEAVEHLRGRPTHQL